MAHNPLANINHTKSSVHFDTRHGKGIEFAWGLRTPHNRFHARQPWFLYLLGRDPSVGCGAVIKYPQGESGPAVVVYGS